MPGSLEGVIAGIPGYAGYRAAEEMNQKRGLQDLAQAGALQSIVAKIRENQLAQQFRSELSGARTDEERSAIALKYGAPKDIIAHADSQAKVQANKELAMSRLTQAAQQFRERMSMAERGATTNEQRLALEQAKQKFDQWAKGQIVAIAQGKAAYELPPELVPSFASAPSGSAAPTQPASPVAPQLPTSVPESDRAAFEIARTGGAATVERQVTPEEKARMADVIAPRNASPASPAPAPAPSPTMAPAPTLEPEMPDAIKRGSRKVQDQWRTAQTRNSQEAAKIVQTQVTKGLEENYSRLRDAPQALASIEKAKALIPTANLFVGSLGEQKLAITKFFNNNLGTNLDLEGVKSAEELRTRIFFNIMDNLKKMDAQPSQLQQKIMMEALGNLGTDPGALGRVLDAFSETIRQKVAVYQNQIEEAKKSGVNWPHNINIPAKASPSAPTQPNQKGWSIRPK